MKCSVPVYYECIKEIEVESISKEEAFEKVKNNIIGIGTDCPQIRNIIAMKEYREDTLEIDGDIRCVEITNVSSSGYVKTASYSKFENDISVSQMYSDGSVRGEFLIKNTELGFQLTAYHDSWKVLKDCTDLIELLGSHSMAGVTMEMLFEEIKNIGYVGEVY